MDIKSRNKHKLGICLVIATIVSAALIALSLYPFIGKRAQEYEQWSQEAYKEMASDDVARQVMNGVYSIWMEYKQEEAGYLLTPSQVFLPDLPTSRDAAIVREQVIFSEDTEAEEEWDAFEVSYRFDSLFYNDIQSFLDQRGRTWKSLYQQFSDNIGYQLTDKNDNRLLEKEHSSNERMVRSEIIFDSLGHMTIAYTQDDGADQLTKTLGQSLAAYVDYDPVRESFDEEYQYSGVRFQNPQDVKFQFWIPESLLSGAQMNSQELSIDMMVDNGVVRNIVLSLLAVVALIALILPGITSLRLGQEKIFRAPFGIVTIVAVTGFVSVVEGYILPAMVTTTLNGLLQSEIMKMGLGGDEANFLVWGSNFVVWVVGFALAYWVVTCYRAVFSIGLWRYIKERTFIGYFFTWLKRHWDRFYQMLQGVDFRQKSSKIIGRIVLVNFLVLTLVCCLWFFGVMALIIYSVLLFFVLTKYWSKMQSQYETLLDAFHQVAAGNFDTRIEDNLGLFEPFREELDTIQDGLKLAVEKEVKSQRMKSELITNVSHDLKTPLTAIITYVNLLKEEDISEADRASYIAVLEQKSMRLKVLIEDLFEVSKANSNNITLHPEAVDVVNLMKQVRLELSDQLLSSGIDFRWALPEEKVIVTLDGQKTCRIFENLLINIAKYAMSGTRAYIDLAIHGDEVCISFRNISASEFQASGQDLTERFIRGDESRNTEGSGLGLAIAKSFTEVQGGRMIAQTEADLFRVLLYWPINQ